MSASIKASADGTQAIIQVGGVDKVTIGSTGITSGVSGGGLVTATAQNTTSGTAIDFTGIPSWVKRITVMFNGVSTNGTSHYLIQVGNGSVVSTGYASASYNGTAVTSTTGMVIEMGAAGISCTGFLVLAHIGSNIWISNHSTGRVSDGVSNSGGGNISLGGALDRIRLTTANGTDTFDAGSINILYE